MSSHSRSYSYHCHRTMPRTYSRSHSGAGRRGNIVSSHSGSSYDGVEDGRARHVGRDGCSYGYGCDDERETYATTTSSSRGEEDDATFRRDAAVMNEEGALMFEYTGRRGGGGRRAYDRSHDNNDGDVDDDSSLSNSLTSRRRMAKDFHFASHEREYHRDPYRRSGSAV